MEDSDSPSIQYEVSSRYLYKPFFSALASFNQHVSTEEKRIEVSLQEQRLTAFEVEQIAYQARTASGRLYR
jgi:hypothetical protein